MKRCKKVMMGIVMIMFLVRESGECYAKTIEQDEIAQQDVVTVSAINEIASGKEETIIPQEEQEIVDNIMDNYKEGIPESYARTIDFIQIEEDLKQLKTVYPDKSYEQLWDMMNEVDSEEEADELFEGVQEEEINVATWTTQKNSVMAAGASTTGNTTQEKAANDKALLNFLNFNCVKYIEDGSGDYEQYIAQKMFEDGKNYIPGLMQARTSNGLCETMIPQGICNAGSYLLISACDDYNKGEHKKQFNSVVYIVDRKTLKLQTTLGLDTHAHVGGIAYDSEHKNLWVCDTSVEGKNHMRLYHIDAEAMVRKGIYSNITATKKDIEIDVSPSFCSLYQGILWVGKFTPSKLNQCKIIGYKIKGAKGRKLEEYITLKDLPIKMQGMNFYYSNRTQYLAVSSSHGRDNDSNIFLYRMDGVDFSKKGTYEMDKKFAELMVVPSMLEGMVHYGTKMYLIFESAAIPYRTGEDKFPKNKANWQCDRIAVTTTGIIY